MHTERLQKIAYHSKRFRRIKIASFSFNLLVKQIERFSLEICSCVSGSHACAPRICKREIVNLQIRFENNIQYKWSFWFIKTQTFRFQQSPHTVRMFRLSFGCSPQWKNIYIKPTNFLHLLLLQSKQFYLLGCWVHFVERTHTETIIHLRWQRAKAKSHSSVGK